MNDTLEQTLAFHCAPALAGIKPANLVSCCFSAYPNLERDILRLNRELNPSGIILRPICRCGTRLLLLVYRRRAFELHLADPHILAYLYSAGYPSGGAGELLECLQQKLQTSGDFPHEMGIFLGYPPEDVDGFQRNDGKNYKLTGYWKVYGDEEKARELFARFTRCRNALCAHMRRGVTLTQLFRTA